MNNNYNNLYCDYIGATGSYSISDYIDITSNTLNTNIDIRSNILNTKIDTRSNILKLYTDTNIINLDNKYKKLIREVPENSLTNLYINNSNIGGETRFYIKQSGVFDIYNSSGQPYRVKIGADGLLYLYYNYNIAIGVFETERWVEPVNMLIGHNVALGNLGTITGATDIAVGKIFTDIGKINTDIAQLNSFVITDNIITNADKLILRDTTTIYGNLKIIFDKIKNTITYVNTVYAGIVGSLGFGAVYMAYGFIQSKVNADYIENNLKYQLTSNTVMTPEQKEQLKIDTFITYTSNINDMNYFSCNLNIMQGFINCNIQTQQTIPDLYTSNLYVNSGNINGIDINNLKTSGNIIENGLSLSSKYITSNQIYNLSNNYTAERQYPPKLYNNTQLEDTSLLKGIQRFHSSLYLNNTGIAYGSGYYDIFSSSTYINYINSKDNLFNFNTADTTPRARFANSLYNSGTGSYIGNDTLDGSYYGDFVVLKMPQQISLTRYRIYNFADTPTKGPSLWKVYGSNDGISFTEITEASQTSRLTSYTNNYYEKTITGISPLYSYIAFVFSALLSTSGQAELSFAELQIFGKELLNQSIVSNVYTTSNAVKNIVEFDMAIVAKHYGFYITITTSININGTTYYKYDIDLRKYTQLGVIQIGPQSGDTFRSFKIRVMYATMFFSYIIKDLPNVCYYEVFMSYKNTAIPPNFVSGLNACAIGYPPNTTLQTIMPNNLFVIKNGAGSIDYITVISTSAADCRVIIEDMLG
jgi:hypothetical protein